MTRQVSPPAVLQDAMLFGGGVTVIPAVGSEPPVVLRLRPALSREEIPPELINWFHRGNPP